MPTRGNPRLIARAVRCFQLQTWPERELIILTCQRSAQLEALVANDPRIRVYDTPAGLSLGDLRNFTVARAAGTYVATWYDDDCHGPERIRSSMHTLLHTDAQAVFLRRLLIWMETNERLALSGNGVWENTMVARRSALPAYPALQKGSDTAMRFLMEQHSKVALIDQPWLYAYCYTGENTWDENHFLGFLNSCTHEFKGSAYKSAMTSECFQCLYLHGLF